MNKTQPGFHHFFTNRATETWNLKCNKRHGAISMSMSSLVLFRGTLRNGPAPESDSSPGMGLPQRVYLRWTLSHKVQFTAQALHCVCVCVGMGGAGGDAVQCRDAHHGQSEQSDFRLD